MTVPNKVRGAKKNAKLKNSCISQVFLSFLEHCATST